MIDLDHPAGKGPAAYRDYVGALGRLLGNAPTHPDLIGVQEEMGRVPITQENVAIEARRSRKRISGETSAFPKLAGYIKSLRPTHGVSDNTTERLQRQAEDLKLLDQYIVALRSQLAASALREEELQLDFDEARSEIRRLKEVRAAA